MAVPLAKLVSFLDRELDVASFQDDSANGLQVEGAGQIRTVGLAVDACMRSFRAAADRDCELVLVHHGLIWGGLRSVRGNVRARLSFLLEHGIGLYAAHLPLDAHARWGNNAGLAKLLGLRRLRPFAVYRGRPIGLAGTLGRPRTAAELAVSLKKALGGAVSIAGASGRARSLGKKKPLRRIGVVSGGGSMALPEAIDAGLDCLVTGEGTLAASREVEDGGIVVLYAGHYETETLGVKSAGAALRKRFGVGSAFLDVPPRT